jgi:hypothetical protein
MPRRFRKNPDVQIVIVPGHGRVYDIDILEGDQYAQYAPHLLREIGVPDPKPVVVSVPAPAAAIAFRDALATASRDTVPLPEEPATLETDAPSTDAAPVKRKGGRPKKVVASPELPPEP